VPQNTGRWGRADFDARIRFLPETKNGRARSLALRQDLIDVLRDLSCDTSWVFDVGIDHIFGGWSQACAKAGIDGRHIHDARHEALSRLAGANGFALTELQLFSGQRDLRTPSVRYAHGHASRLASRLDECFPLSRT